MRLKSIKFTLNSPMKWSLMQLLTPRDDVDDLRPRGVHLQVLQVLIIYWHCVIERCQILWPVVDVARLCSYALPAGQDTVAILFPILLYTLYFFSGLV